MIWRSVAAILSLLGFVFGATPCFAQSGSGFDQTTARRAGLEQLWSTQLEVDALGGRVGSITAHVSSTRANTYFEVIHQRGRTVFSEYELDRFGDRLGRAGAAHAALKHLGEIIRASSTRDGKLDADLQATQQLVDQQLKVWENKRDAKDPAGLEQIAEPLLDQSRANPDKLPRLMQRVVPEIILYAASADGTIQAIDGETGRVRWTTKVGVRGVPTLAPAASDEYVAVLNGQNLFVLSPLDGEVLWSKKIQDIPGAAPAISDSQIFVPLLRGLIVAYSLRDPGTWPARYPSHGRNQVQPIVVNASLIWPTDRNYLIVANAERPGLRYRLEAKAGIVSRPAFLLSTVDAAAAASRKAEAAKDEASGDVFARLFVTSLDGYLYCLHENQGSLLWRFSVGEPLASTPFALDGSVYAISELGNLYSIGVQSGREQWVQNGEFKNFVAGSQERLYCADDSGRLVVIDTKSGSRLATLDTEQWDVKLLNTISDRIYLATSSGRLQAWRESRNYWPLIHAGGSERPKEVKPKDETKAADDATEAGAETEGDAAPAADPFEAGTEAEGEEGDGAE